MEAPIGPTGSGRTSAQMRDAGPKAHFVWCTDDIAYPQSLAVALGRDDLRIHPASWLEAAAVRLRGISPALIVLDHALVPTAQQQRGYDLVRERQADVPIVVPFRRAADAWR